MFIFRVKIVCRVACFFFLSWNSPSGVEQFCILSEPFYPILIDMFPVWSVVAMYFFCTHRCGQRYLAA